MINYQSELKRSMEWLASKPDTYFLGQSVGNEGTSVYSTLKDIPMDKRLELPIIEETQMGMTLGMCLNNTIPISIYPRFDFLILATNQLVNHLNRIKDYSNGEFIPKAIIRTSIGSINPLNPQSQHRNDYTKAYQLMLDNFEVIRLDSTEMIYPSYEKAYNRTDGKCTLLIEWADAFDPDWNLKT